MRYGFTKGKSKGIYESRLSRVRWKAVVSLLQGVISSHCDRQNWDEIFYTSPFKDTIFVALRLMAINSMKLPTSALLLVEGNILIYCTKAMEDEELLLGIRECIMYLHYIYIFMTVDSTQDRYNSSLLRKYILSRREQIGYMAITARLR